MGNASLHSTVFLPSTEIQQKIGIWNEIGADESNWGKRLPSVLLIFRESEYATLAMLPIIRFSNEFEFMVVNSIPLSSSKSASNENAPGLVLINLVAVTYTLSSGIRAMAGGFKRGIVTRPSE